MRNYIKILALVFIFAFSACGQAKKAGVVKQNESKEAADFSIRFIANEGVLIRAAGKQILIDSLHREYKPAYAFPPPDLQKLPETAAKPYDKINLLLVSHLHMVKSQIKPVTHEWKKAVEYNQDGIKVRFLGLHHSGENFRWVQNFGHLIEVGGKKLLHIGDADMTAENFSSFNLSKENIDVAFIPYRFLLSENGRKLVKEQFNPKQIIAVHIPPGEAGKTIEKLKKDSPETVAFTKILEERSF